jgi:hypothetical protein
MKRNIAVKETVLSTALNKKNEPLQLFTNKTSFVAPCEFSDTLLIPRSPLPTENLKGQCHEMVDEMRPWSSNLGLN